MSTAVKNLISILDLERLEDNLFRGRSPQDGWQRVYGGQVIGQALVAASRTVDASRLAHSLHGYFMLGGDPKVPIIYEVERIRDGGSFTTRRVVAIQHGRAIFSMSCSFHIDEPGLDHQFEMPDVPQPETLPGEAELVSKFPDMIPEPILKYWQRERPIEFRPVDLSRYLGAPKKEPYQQLWFRATAPLPDSPEIQRCALAYASDMTLLDTSLVAHGRSVFEPDMMVASLDHAMWFHRPCKFDDWLLYAEDSPSSQGARGFNRGLIFTRDGTLVASTVQEGLIRQVTRDK